MILPITESISDTVDLSEIKKRQFNLITTGCGTGKSYFVAVNILSKMPEIKPSEVIFLTSRKITQDQQVREYREYISEFSRYEKTFEKFNGSYSDPLLKDFESRYICIMTYDKLIDALISPNTIKHESLEKVKLVIFDECHTLFSDKFIQDMEVIKVWIRESTYRQDKIYLGLTATPNIIYANKKRWGVETNVLNKEIFIRYQAEKLYLTSYNALPYLFNRNILAGKSIILCQSAKDCFSLQLKIKNSAVLVSKANDNYTKEMDYIYNHIIEYSRLPENYIDSGGNSVPLEVLIATTTLREGINLNPDSDVQNVICCIPDDLHVIQFMGRCRYDIKNLIVAKEHMRYNINVDSYLKKIKKAFYKYIEDRDTYWFDSIKHLLRDETSVYRVAVDLNSFINYIDEYWVNKKIITDDDKIEIRDIGAGCGIIDAQQSKISFNKIIGFIHSLGYEIESGRQIINGRKYTFKIIRKGAE